MNAFEDIVRLYLEEKGYWVRQSVKVNISKEDKIKLKKPSMPRPEIDIVALNAKENELLLIEVKSFLDSYGVHYEGVSGKDRRDAERYKLFTDSLLRETITKSLFKEYLKQGLINKETNINYALAAGKIHSKWDEEKIDEYFSQNGWKLFSPNNIKDKIRELAEKGWEDNPITITAKLILRG